MDRRRSSSTSSRMPRNTAIRNPDANLPAGVPEDDSRSGSTSRFARPSFDLLAGFGGLLFVVAAIAFLEWRDPYYFCQDDALVAELPGSLFACRAVWQGILPEYNPHNFLGSPLLSVGGGFLYPPIYAAYGFARHVLGDEFATFDVFAIGHLIVGYWLAFQLALRAGVSPTIAAVFGCTFVLSGAIVIMGRCWHAFNALAVFIPLLALLAERLRRGPVGWAWTAGTAVSLGLLYHAGFPQLFVVGTGFFVLSVVLAVGFGLVPWRRALWLAPALLFGAAFCLPVVVQQGEIARGMIQTPGGGEGIGRHLASMLAPHPIVTGSLPNAWASGNDHHGGHFYYFGSVLLLLSLLAVGWLTKDLVRGVPIDRHRLLYAVLAVVAFALALGRDGILWRAMGLLPRGFDNNPFRVLPWFVFYASLLGALEFERAVAGFIRLLDPGEIVRLGGAGRVARRVTVGVVAAAAILLALHVQSLDIAFYLYGFDPYPRLPAGLAATLSDEGRPRHRLLSLAAMRSSDPSYPLAIPHDLTCQYELPALYGYDPVMQSHRAYLDCLKRVMADPQRGLEAYGVRRIVAHRTLSSKGSAPRSANSFERVLPLAEVLDSIDKGQMLTLGESDAFVRVFDLPDAAPLAFTQADTASPFPVRLRADGVDVDLAGRRDDRPVVVNVLWWPRLTATAAEQTLKLAADEWGRVVVDVPAGASTLAVRYRPDWLRGAGLASLAAAFGLVGGLGLGRFGREDSMAAVGVL